ncbi:hypothetical protein Pla22_36640 [Rubripirellula amarantea]|uniref:Uncharacterized protein n=1 Tax=Rubripirellula amarantea TaxID=2527999 RepID=A0A5C5WLG9_9BACT|nr:DUF58 domain-containing protein [Rubripirellula amarantea]TWT50921.1 hypothetical protein Pla22_36640 [Rubripirellula amarantea]
MAIVHAAPDEQGWLSRLMTTDFCPWANRFVYWLKEPIGWFALATAISIMIGLYFSPIGWTLAASLTAIMAIGMAWPWIAVRVTVCGLQPETAAVHEDASCRMVLSVHNRIPMTVWGLAIEGYLDCDSTTDLSESAPTVGLACVPPLCVADYAVEVTPTMRGHYPVSVPQVACSFPFGIWTARRPVREVQSLTVWPIAHRIAGMLPLVGLANADQGDGSRGGQSGDFVGVRSLRRGDSAKHINWVASARSDSLIVTERGGPQSVTLEVFVDTRNDSGRDALARRIRAAASVLSSLHQSRIETRVRLGDQLLKYRPDSGGRRRMLDALASVPMDGEECRDHVPNHAHASVRITGALNDDTSSESVVVTIENPRGGRRAGGNRRQIVIGPREDLQAAMADLWREVRDVAAAA